MDVRVIVAEMAAEFDDRSAYARKWSPFIPRVLCEEIPYSDQVNILVRDRADVAARVIRISAPESADELRIAIRAAVEQHSKMDKAPDLSGGDWQGD